MADSVPRNPNVWSDGSRDEDLDAMVGVAGAGAFVRNVPWVFDGRAWGHAQDLNLDDDAARIFSMVPGPLQTVQRAEYWGELFSHCKPSCMSIWVLIIKISAITLVRFLMAGLVHLSVFALMGTYFAVFTIWLSIGLLALSRSVR